MATGYKHTIKIHEDDTGTVVFDSFERKAFNHDGSFTVATTAVVKEDFTGTPNDAFTVQISYPSGSEPALSVSITTLTTTAKNAVNAAFANGEAGAPS